MLDTLIGPGGIPAAAAVQAARRFGTPLYLYHEGLIVERCRRFTAMPNAFGVLPRYAMKANSSRALLQLITAQGFSIDASSLNEARRAVLAGIDPAKILLTAQEVPRGEDRSDLEDLILKGLKYNVCSLTQQRAVAPFAAQNGIPLGMRIHPGVGSGESASRNTGDKYSCFGVHLTDVPKALELAEDYGLTFDLVHVHIGSGGDPEAWRDNIRRELGFIEEFFPDATTVNFGGGFKEARMPDETPADIEDLGLTAKSELESFHARTGRALTMEVEPGNFIVANAGSVVTSVLDIKQTGADGFRFVLVDGGMEVIARPLLYGARHPFTVLDRDGNVLSDDWRPGAPSAEERRQGEAPAEHPQAGETRTGERPLEGLIVVGRCCESGDSLTLDAAHNKTPRRMALPEVGDYLVVGGAGAYCSSMSLVNYNSFAQPPEVLLERSGDLKLIRSRQSLEQMTANEVSR